MLLTIIFQIGHDGISQTKNQVELFIAPTISNIWDKHLHADENTKAGFRFDVGISYMRRIIPRVSIGTGFSYSRMGYNYTDTFIDYGGHYTTPGNSFTVKDKVLENYIELPLKFSAQINNNTEHSFLFDFNVINQLLISTKRTSNRGGDTKRNFKELRDADRKIYNLAVQIGATYQKSFTNNLFFGLSPFYKAGSRNPSNWNVGLKIIMGYNF